MQRNRQKYRIFFSLEEHLEIPMFLFALIWLYLFVKEMISGLGWLGGVLIYVIWGLFVIEYILKLILAPRRLRFIKHNWITLLALVVPALRIFRIFNALTVLGSVQVVTTTNIIRAVTSGKRFLSALKEAQGPAPVPEMDMGIVVAYSKPKNRDALLAYVKQLKADVKKELEISTGINWTLDITDEVLLENDQPRRPSDFLDTASQRMAEGPYDLVTVVTDVGLMSRKHMLMPGLSSPVTRVMVISTRKLTTTGKGKPNLSLSEENVRLNGAALLLRLIGQIFGLKKTSPALNTIMGARDFDRELSEVPSFNDSERKKMKKRANRAPDRELKEGNWLESFVFHLLMSFRHPRQFFIPLIKNNALFLPLSLPSLATAAFAPALILLFTAEIWDVGFGMTNSTAITFAVVSVMLASFYLVRVQSLFLPRKEKRVLTEHLAVANSVIYCSIFLACIGLFLLVVGLMLLLEIYVFPPDLMQTWPTLEVSNISFVDELRLAVFISTIGVTTGALGGGLEKRTVIQHLALFRKRT
ncbi:MAG: hypothetical protein WBV11_00320 [Salegentibacter sp.]